MGTATPHHFQLPPNPNPNFDPGLQNFNDLMFFHEITNYLMSDLEFEESIGTQDKRVLSENLLADSCPDESSIISVPNLDCGIKCGRELQKYEVQEKVRFAFKTKTTLDFMDDGFKWRKYGKKKVKTSPNPRNYFKCKSKGCNVKKRVERDSEDPSYVITTYEGVHNHN